jgi:hypothetical protein
MKPEAEEMVKSTEEMTAAIEAEGILIDDARDEDEKPKMCTTNGDPVDKTRAEQTQETGQFKSYVVLCPDERAKGFVRPYRDSYKHRTCGTVTTMGRALSETYARDPKFYGGTFCAGCNVHFPVGEFQWTADGKTVGS